LFAYDKVFLYNPSWPQTQDPSASAAQVLGLQACATEPNSFFFLIVVVLGFELRVSHLLGSSSIRFLVSKESFILFNIVQRVPFTGLVPVSYLLAIGLSTHQHLEHLWKGQDGTSILGKALDLRKL
jgi:hypothetical protein